MKYRVEINTDSEELARLFNAIAETNGNNSYSKVYEYDPTTDTERAIEFE